MNEFLGRFQHSLQPNGRLAFPAAYRGLLGEGAIMTKGLEHCVIIMPFNIWSSLTKELGDHPLVDSKKRQLRRLLSHSAFTLEFDAQGRILIPEELRLYANLGKTVIVAGSLQWVEVWDRDMYQEHLDSLDTTQLETL